MLNRNRQKGFTLIELLIVVAIIGIIAAILIPNLLDALQKSKQKRTIADMRNTGTAWMSWLTDQVGAASAGAGTKMYPGSLHSPLDYSVLLSYLNQPHSNTFFYMQEVPEFDGWNHSFDFALNPDLVQSAVMMICSRARGGDYTTPATSCNETWNVRTFIGTDYDQDIVWADGYFVQTSK